MSDKHKWKYSTQRGSLSCQGPKLSGQFFIEYYCASTADFMSW